MKEEKNQHYIVHSVFFLHNFHISFENSKITFPAVFRFALNFKTFSSFKELSRNNSVHVNNLEFQFLLALLKKELIWRFWALGILILWTVHIRKYFRTGFQMSFIYPQLLHFSTHSCSSFNNRIFLSKV